MNNNKCKGCQWYGKPYWSINNPCHNCPRDNIQVLTRWEDPTIEQLQQENKQLKEEIEEYKRIEQADLEAFNNYDSILTKLKEYIKPLVTEREDEKYYSISWYCKDVLLHWLGEKENEYRRNR